MMFKKNMPSIVNLFVCCVLFFSSSLAVQAQETDAYRLKVGDVVRIQVFGEDELTLSIQLNEQGVFTYPYLGDLQALGKTVSEMQAMIVSGLKGDYLLDPKVSVSVESYREVYVGGEVSQAGSFPFQPGLTVGKVIVLAGGFTERSARTRITVVSESDNGTSSKSKRVGLNHVLRPGDVVNVPRRFF